MNKFEIIYEGQLVDYLIKGYEIIAQYENYYTSSRNLTGTMMNNSFSINDFPVRESQTMFVMKRGPQAEVLFGKKDENN